MGNSNLKENCFENEYNKIEDLTTPFTCQLIKRKQDQKTFIMLLTILQSKNQQNNLKKLLEKRYELQNPFIVQVYQVFSSFEVNLCSQFYAINSVIDHLTMSLELKKKLMDFNFKEIIYMSTCILQGVFFLQSESLNPAIIHEKTIFFSIKKIYKIADDNLFKEYNQSVDHIYYSPEQLKNMKYGFDIEEDLLFQLGILLISVTNKIRTDEFYDIRSYKIYKNKIKNQLEIIQKKQGESFCIFLKNLLNNKKTDYQIQNAIEEIKSIDLEFKFKIQYRIDKILQQNIKDTSNIYTTRITIQKQFILNTTINKIEAYKTNKKFSEFIKVKKYELQYQTLPLHQQTSFLKIDPLLNYSAFNSDPKRLQVQNKIQKEIIEDQEIITQHGIYRGKLINNKREGLGQFKYFDGHLYKGDFKNDKFSGKGKLYDPQEQLIYQGEWQDNAFHGFGTLYNPECSYSHELLDFNCIQITNNWTKYEGYFINEMKDGLGSIFFVNGEKFTGVFKEDFINGKGVFYPLDGDQIQGEWRFNNLLQ